MRHLIIALIALSGLAFVLATVSVFEATFGDNPIMGIRAEAFSRASSNLALLSIAIAACFGFKR